MPTLIAAIAASLLVIASPTLAVSSSTSSSPLIARNLSSTSTTSSATSSYHFDERSGILTEFDPLRPLPVKRGETYTASIGLMLERDNRFEPRANTFQKRKYGDVDSPRWRGRDSGTEVVQVEFSKRGDLVLPGNVLEKRKKQNRNQQKKRKNKSSSKKKKKTSKNKSKKKTNNNNKKKSTKQNNVINSVQKKSTSSNFSSSSSNGIQRSLIKLASSIPSFKAVITWYTGVDLQLPACCDKSGWTPTDDSLISAVTLDWKDKPQCGAFLQLKSPKNNKSIIVRQIDLCAGCKPGVPHVDLSIAAFKALYALDVGKVSDIQVSTLAGPPFEKWTPQLTKLYGPQNL